MHTLTLIRSDRNTESQIAQIRVWCSVLHRRKAREGCGRAYLVWWVLVAGKGSQRPGQLGPGNKAAAVGTGEVNGEKNSKQVFQQRRAGEGGLATSRGGRVGFKGLPPTSETERQGMRRKMTRGLKVSSRYIDTGSSRLPFGREPEVPEVNWACLFACQETVVSFRLGLGISIVYCSIFVCI